MISSAIIVVPKGSELKKVATTTGYLRFKQLHESYIEDPKFKCYLVPFPRCSFLAHVDNSVIGIDSEEIQPARRLYNACDFMDQWKFYIDKTHDEIPKLNIIRSVDEEFYGVKKRNVSVIWFTLTDLAKERYMSFFS